jgi:oligopeptide/dipeptide ABC transporter ATP-binding protein
MYAGKIVETGPVEEVLRAPRHPYTRVLVSSVPDPTVQARRERHPQAGTRTVGDVPSLLDPAHNCPFHTRCPHAREICRSSPPPTVVVGTGHTTTCHLVASGEL